MQHYTPLGSLFLSALVASAPVIVLLGLLALMHVRAQVAAIVGLLVSFAIATAVYGMPVPMACAAAGYGAAFGLFPIGWIVLCAIFIYDITVQTGKFEIAKQSIAGLSGDQRIQALLIAYCFGAFIEGAAGFGTPVAISAAMLIGLGFKPLPAASLALIGNTAPVAYGALGTPIITLAAVTKLNQETLSAMVGRQLPFFSVIVPFWLIWAMAGWRGMLEVWPACLTTGLTFAICQFLVSNYHGPWVVDIVGAIVSMLALMALMRIWQPRSRWRYENDEKSQPAGSSFTAGPMPSRRHIFSAWMPWMVLSIFVFVWGLQPIKDLLNGGPSKKPVPIAKKEGTDEIKSTLEVSGDNFLKGISVLKIPVPYLDKAVIRNKPVVKEPEPEAAVFTFNWLSATGTSLFLAGIVAGLLLGLSPAALLQTFFGTLLRVRVSLLTIAAMLALGFTTRFAGLDATMGLAFASTGFLFPFFSPLLGWLGVALTGSDTSSNVLFGNLQQLTAQQVGISPVLAAAANSSGGVMGKMIDAQSIVVASVATGRQGEEGIILRSVFLHSLALAALVGVVVFLQAYVFTWMIPK